MTIVTPILEPKIQPEVQPQKMNRSESPVMLFGGMTWREFRAVEQLIDRPGYRLSFLDGVLEILQMPSELHETVKERIGALLELYLLMAKFEFTPTGSMTLESEVDQVKREADKSYRLKDHSGRPDLAIEIVVSSGGINKLEAYKRLKISELWFWEDGVLDLYHLRGTGNKTRYEKIATSEEVSGINLALLKQCVLMNSHVEALKVWQKAIEIVGNV